MMTTTTTTTTTTGTARVSVVETVHGTEKKPRSAQQWQEASRVNTQRVIQTGANVPLAWVLVHGRNIPPNALIAGEDKRRPLYIARTFWEGGVIIGQAGTHLAKGASFAYNGREMHADTYEVLVPLQQTITYHVADNYSIPTIPRITRGVDQVPTIPRVTRGVDQVVDVTFTQLVQKLRTVKVVMVIDDSISMEGQFWCQAREALTGLVSVIESDLQTNGIDLCFLNNPAFESNIRDRRRIEELFDSVCPSGSTPTGQKLQELFTRYIPLIESPSSTSAPIVLMLITDGVPTDNVESVIIDGARRLDHNQVPQHRFGLSFVQIGNDPDAAEFLRELDDDISVQYGCRDMVNATPYSPQAPEFTRDLFLKCVLGSINPYYDGFPSHISPKVAPKSPGTPVNVPSAEYGYQAGASPMYVAPQAPVASFPSPRMGLRSPPPLHPQSQFFYPGPPPLTN